MLRRPNWWMLILGGLVSYTVYFMDQYGAIALIPQIFLSFVGGRLLLRSVWVSERKSQKYNKNVAVNKATKKTRRKYQNYGILVIVAMLVIIPATSPVHAEASTNYFILTTTQDFDNGTVNNIWTHTDNSSVVNGTFELSFREVWLADTFDSETVGSFPDNWALGSSNPASVCEVSATQDKSSPNSMYVFAQAYDAGMVYNRSDYNILEVTVEVYMPGVAEYAYITLNDDPDFNVNDAAYLMFRNDGHIRAYDGVTDYDLGNYIVGWTNIRLADIDYSANTYDIYVNGVLKQIDVPFRDASQTQGRYFHVGANRNSVERYIYVDDVEIKNQPVYSTSGNWTSQNISAGSGLCEDYYTNITYGNVSATDKIDKIEWLQNDTAVATYGTDITSGTYKNITQVDLTSGNFTNITGNYSMKVYLVGGGSASCYVSSLSGMGDVQNVTAPEEEPVEHLPISTVSPNPTQADPFSEFLQILQVNESVVILVTLAFFALLLIVYGGKS